MLEKALMHLIAGLHTSSVATLVASGKYDVDAAEKVVCQVVANYWKWSSDILADPAWPTPQIAGVPDLVSALTKLVGAAAPAILPAVLPKP
jgi:hypothetical protein